MVGSISGGATDTNLMALYPLVICYIAIENDPVISCIDS